MESMNTDFEWFLVEQGDLIKKIARECNIDTLSAAYWAHKGLKQGASYQDILEYAHG